MRMRAIWVVGWVLMVTQLTNIVVMTITYGGWTYDHAITVSVAVLVVVTIHCVRWYKNQLVYATFYSALIFLAVLGSAVPEGTGINTALLPFLALGPVINGFIAGRRAAWIFAGVGAVYFTVLLYISLNNPPQTITGTYVREINRYCQAMFALSMSTVMSVMLSERVYSALADMRQITDRAVRAEAAKSEFLATMSHELRTPLNGVIGLTDALAAGQLPEHEKQLTRTIRQSGESLLQILNDLLDLSKIEAGKLSIEPRSFDLSELLASVTDVWRAAASAKGLTISHRIKGRLPSSVIGDDLRLRQILQNLVSNGIKFTAEGGVSICAEVSCEEDEWCDVALRVTDTGKGIPEDLVSTVFEPFEQGERGTTRTYGGTGLGLPICRMLAELMGGTIDVEKSSSRGTTFVLKLRLKVAKSELASLNLGPDHQDPSLEGLRVLIAEDNEVNRLVLNEFLKPYAGKLVFAEDGPTCLRLAESTEFDVILMDKHMPGMNGSDVTRAIRALQGSVRSIPIIAVTADAMTGEREALMAAGMDDFLAKPVRADELKKALTRTLSRKAAA